MKERPILFSGAMVRALLDGTKTQTRRVVKGAALDWLERDAFTPEFVALPDNQMCPYGQPGDSLWVRETARCIMRGSNGLSGALQKPTMEVQYGAGGSERFDSFGDWFPGSNLIKGSSKPRWCPSIHMPRWASRITLEITGVRVERLKDISEADATAEGVELGGPIGHLPTYLAAPYAYQYAQLWESINGPGSWDANPWVWAIEFKRLP